MPPIDSAVPNSSAVAPRPPIVRRTRYRSEERRKRAIRKWIDSVIVVFFFFIAPPAHDGYSNANNPHFPERA
jgi:hypothetical protein